MKRLTLTLVALAASAFAQRHQPINAATMSPYRAMPSLPGATPGNILNPGGATSLHPSLLGGTISGSIPYTGVRPGGGYGHGGYAGRNRTIVVPYAVPVYGGGYYDTYAGYAGYGMMPQQQQPVTVVMPQQPAPSIVINHYNSPDATRPTVTVENTERGELKVYEATPRRAEKPAPDPTRSYVRDDKPNIYMLVMKDAKVRQAIGYWVEGDLLKYVTPQATISSVLLRDIDRTASARLNAQNKLERDSVAWADLSACLRVVPALDHCIPVRCRQPGRSERRRVITVLD
jgi:hypothetical protein